MNPQQLSSESQNMNEAGKIFQNHATEIFGCKKCNLTFTMKTDLTQHDKEMHRAFLIF